MGKSEGSHGNITGEIEDLKSIVTWAKEQWSLEHLYFAGFSFGSYIAAAVAAQENCELLISIAPPVTNMPFKDLPDFPCPWIVIQGDADEVVSPEAVFDWIEGLEKKPQLIRMSGVGHFFHGKLIDLKENILNTLSGELPK